MILAVMACPVATRAAGQDTTGTIAGRIVDAQGLAIPRVTVMATGPQGVKTNVSDDERRFTVSHGDFRIDATLTSVPSECPSPVLLIRNAGGVWFAAGVPKGIDDWASRATSPASRPAS